MFFDSTRVFHMPKRRFTSRRGFSLIEMLVVLVLLGILASLVTVNVRHYMVKGKISAARVDIASIEHALSAFYSENGKYPSNEDGLASLTNKKTTTGEPLLEKLPNDPWGHPYQYLCPGRNNEHYEIMSYGKDGREGGTGEDTDISSNDAARQGTK
jgi:general secretion pathway protein G